MFTLHSSEMGVCKLCHSDGIKGNRKMLKRSLTVRKKQWKMERSAKRRRGQTKGETRERE